MATLDDTLPLALSQQVSGVSDYYLRELEDEFRNLGWWGSGSTQQWLDVALPIVLEAEETIASIADAMMEAELEILLDGDVTSGPVDVASVTGANVRGVDPATVYTRPLGEVWRAVGAGKPIGESLDIAVDRLGQIFASDTSRVSDIVSRSRISSEPMVTGYRRVPRGLRSCALCLVASTQRYHKADLKPMHAHCFCTVCPIVGSTVSTQVVDEELLNSIHNAIAEEFGMSARDARQIDYRKIMVEHTHGELGPVLTWRGQNFTGPSDLHG